MKIAEGIELDVNEFRRAMGRPVRPRAESKSLHESFGMVVSAPRSHVGSVQQWANEASDLSYVMQAIRPGHYAKSKLDHLIRGAQEMMPGDVYSDALDVVEMMADVLDRLQQKSPSEELRRKAKELRSKFKEP